MRNGLALALQEFMHWLGGQVYLCDYHSGMHVTTDLTCVLWDREVLGIPQWGSSGKKASHTVMKSALSPQGVAF